MRRISLFIAAVGLVALGGCDSNGPEAAAAETADVLACSTPSISTTANGNFLYVTNLPYGGSVLETRTDGGSWHNAGVKGAGTTQVNSGLWSWAVTGGTRGTIEFRARAICYNSGTYSFSSPGTTTAFYNQDGP